MNNPVIQWLLEGDVAIWSHTFRLEQAGKESRWNTLRALHILKKLTNDS